MTNTLRTTLYDGTVVETKHDGSDQMQARLHHNKVLRALVQRGIRKLG